MEEEDSSPHNLPTWSPVQRLPVGRLNMNYCLEIQVTLTDELGDTPPPSHAWMAQRQWLLAQVGQYFFMGDIPWERV